MNADSIAAQAGICQKNIDGQDYSITLLPAFVGLDVGERIYKALVPALAAAFDGNSEANLFEEATFYTNIAMALVHGQDNLQLITTVQTLLKDISVNGQPIDANMHFRGRFDLMFEVLAWILKENFGSLFINLFKDYTSQILTLKTAMQAQAEALNPDASQD